MKFHVLNCYQQTTKTVLVATSSFIYDPTMISNLCIGESFSSIILASQSGDVKSHRCLTQQSLYGRIEPTSP
jgi:hypothetical protein